MWPRVRSSRPAINRSSVDLPQPEGPTNTTNSPSSISRLTDGMIVTSPNVLFTSFRTILPLMPMPSGSHPSFDCSEGEAAHQLPLGEPPEHQDGRHRHRRGGRKFGPEQSLWARV